MFAQHHTGATDLSAVFPNNARISQIEFSSDILQGFISIHRSFHYIFANVAFGSEPASLLRNSCRISD